MKDIIIALGFIIGFLVIINIFLIAKLNWCFKELNDRNDTISELENELGTLKINYDDLEKDYQLKIYRILQDKGCEEIDYE